MDEHDVAGQALQKVGYVVAGLLFYGGIGWLVDLVFRTAWGLPFGLVLGLVLAGYIIKKRYS